MPATTMPTRGTRTSIVVIRPTAAPITMLSSRMAAGVVLTPDCSIRPVNMPPTPLLVSSRSIAGILLSIAWRTTVALSVGSSAGPCATSRSRSPIRRSAFDDEDVRATNVPAISAVTTMKTTSATSTSLHLDHAVEHVGGQVDAGAPQPLPALRPDAGGPEPTHHPALRVEPGLLEHEDVLHRDDVAFHAGDFRDAGHATRTILQARLLDDDVDRRCNLVTHRLLRQIDCTHRDHRFDTGQRIARRVGVHRGQGSVVTGVHRLQHVQRFFTADLTDD